jgi:hypothetical protein
MGTEMNDSTRNPLIRPVNIGVPQQDAKYNKNPSKPPTVTNIGDKTMTYYKFGTAASVTLTLKDPLTNAPNPAKPNEITYTNDITPGVITDAESKKAPKRDVP